jgi:hypothetical protein
VGKLLSGNGKYVCEYIQGALAAREQGGFEPIHAFPELNARYESDDLFPMFSNRVLPRSRPEYKSVLEWLSIGANEDDRVAILSRSGGRRATDTFEVFPCPEIDSSGEYHVFFLVHGLSHMPPESIQRAEKLQPGEPLLLMKDFQNPADTDAFLLRTAESYRGDVHILGYCPAYLNKEIYSLLGNSDAASPMVVVERVNPDPAPLQFRVLCRMAARPSPGFVPFRGEAYVSLASAKHECSQLEIAPV